MHLLTEGALIRLFTLRCSCLPSWGSSAYSIVLMPRLTNKDYLAIRHFLTRLWDQDDGDSFAVLPGYAQRDLHDFFALTVSMTDEYAVTYRAQLTKARPALPQSAGRAFEALRASLERRPNRMVDRHRVETTHTFKVNGKSRTIRVTAVSRPKIDTYDLAKALVRLAKEDVEGKLLKKALKVKVRNEHDRR